MESHTTWGYFRNTLCWVNLGGKTKAFGPNASSPLPKWWRSNMPHLGVLNESKIVKAPTSCITCSRQITKHEWCGGSGMEYVKMSYNSSNFKYVFVFLDSNSRRHQSPHWPMPSTVCCATLICHRMDTTDENQTPDLWQLHMKKDHHHFSEPNQSQDNWRSIFSSKSRAGSKYFYWIFPFNDMQQMWNEAEARGMGITLLTDCVTASMKPVRDNSRLSS